jgi:methionyl aminopeptidase
MIRLKNEEELVLLQEGGRRLSAIMAAVLAHVAPGVTTRALEQFTLRLIVEGGDEPSFLDYQPAGSNRPYPAALCVSVNEEVVHGLPGDRVLVKGDVVTLDCGLRHRGMYTDMAATIPVGSVSTEVTSLINVTRHALEAGVRAAKPGARLGDIGWEISRVARSNHLAVVKELSGHGVGFAVHEEPFVPNYGKKGSGILLRPGLVLAIEPMFSLGQGDIELRPDGFTFATRDGSISAHFEQTIAITTDGPLVLTAL